MVDDKIQKAVRRLLEEYSQAYQNKDVEGILELFVDSDDLVVIGTGDDEWVNGINELKSGFERDMDQADTINVKFRDISISSSSNVAWLSSHMNMEATVEGQEIYLPGRLTAVVLEKNGKWLFANLHYSLPSDLQEEGKAWPEI
ncbi:nuclear transport factor 2 family protein [Methanobacterium subterraneum]|uniref:Nuclear transport factor 2 family protein n=1 Tax=Methanobacterium subterraneum TaxID=59277 RepID=A0A7K4DN16_9EURY|nr:nuclear transport factor 2 family protein [Methanobacterium subterraneum]NMO09416.1 nuclear transport factor 2 family protein [Methanobacterium subterraneum]